MSQIPDPPSPLTSLLGSYPFRVENKWYHQQVVSLDGYTFVKCRFDNCQIYTTKGTFTLDHCILSGCSVTFYGEAQKAVQLFNVSNPQKLSIWAKQGLDATQNEDGTWSIK